MHTNLNELEVDVQAITKCCEIRNSLNECINSTLHYIFAKIAWWSNRSSIAEHHPESFLVDRMLAFRCSDFFLSWVSSQSILEFLISHEARSDSVDMFTISSLFIEFFSDIEIRMLSWFNSIWENFECKCTKITHVHSLSIEHFLSNVFPCRLEDYVELCFWFNRLVCWICTWLRLLVLSRVVNWLL